VSWHLMAATYGYSYLPKSVYTTQVFPVTIQAVNQRADTPPAFRFASDASLRPLGTIPATVINGSDVFYTFYFQASKAGMIRLPSLKILEANATHSLPGHAVLVEDLDAAAHPDFCGLIAADCTLEASQVSTFDTDKTLVTIRLRAHGANPEAMTVPGAIESGLEQVRRQGPIVTAEYYFVIPSRQKSVTLSYYNTLQHRFVPLTIATDYRNRPVAAQVELNPKASLIEKLKRYGSITLALFFGLMFLWQKDRFYFVLLMIVVVLIYGAYKPKDRLCIREGSPLYILPTHNSRISTRIDRELTTSSLAKHGDYDKINYHNGIIGWIHHDDLCQD